MNLNCPTLAQPADSCSTPAPTPYAPLNGHLWGRGLGDPLLSRGYGGQDHTPPRTSRAWELLLPVRHTRLVSGVLHLHFPLPGKMAPMAGFFSFVICSEALAGLPVSSLHPTHYPITFLFLLITSHFLKFSSSPCGLSVAPAGI